VHAVPGSVQRSSKGGTGSQAGAAVDGSVVGGSGGLAVRRLRLVWSVADVGWPGHQLAPGVLHPPQGGLVTLIYLDTETTGLDPYLHYVWEIAYAVDDGPILSSIVRHSSRNADPEALEVGRYWDRLSSGEFDNRATWEFEDTLRAALDGATLVGANPAFDAAMLRARWDAAPWRYRLFDIEAYAMPALGLSEPKGLAYVAEQLGVEQPDHTAACDVRVLRECHRELVRRYRPETA
jgi:hypothetical protein